MTFPSPPPGVETVPRGETGVAWVLRLHRPTPAGALAPDVKVVVTLVDLDGQRWASITGPCVATALSAGEFAAVGAMYEAAAAWAYPARTLFDDLKAAS